MRRTLEQWAKGVPSAIAAGSRAQVEFCIDDAKADIAELARANATMRAAIELALPEIEQEAEQREFGGNGEYFESIRKIEKALRDAIA